MYANNRPYCSMWLSRDEAIELLVMGSRVSKRNLTGSSGILQPQRMWSKVRFVAILQILQILQTTPSSFSLPRRMPLPFRLSPRWQGCWHVGCRLLSFLGSTVESKIVAIVVFRMQGVSFRTSLVRLRRPVGRQRRP